MKLLTKLAMGLTQYILVSFFFSIISVVVMVSLLNHRFPPTLADFKGLKNNFDNIVALKAAIGNSKHLSDLQTGLQNSPTIDGKKILGELKDSAQAYSDPALDDVNELMQYRKKQAQLSESISSVQGHSEAPANANDGRVTASVEEGSKDSRSPESAERMRKLEDLVSRLHDQVQSLTQEVSSLKQQIRHH